MSGVTRKSIAIAVVAFGATAATALTPKEAAACSADPFIGSVCAMAGNFCPAPDYLPAAGQLIPVAQNQALYSLIGTFYGGDGRVNFALPNLQGRTMIGWGDDPSGSGTIRIGQTRGQLTAQVPVKAENLPTMPVSVTIQAAAVNGTHTVPEAGDMLAIANNGARTAIQYPFYAPSSGTTVNLGGVSGVVSGAGTPLTVPTVPPQLAVTYCIAVSGAYPQRQ